MHDLLYLIHMFFRVAVVVQLAAPVQHDSCSDCSLAGQVLGSLFSDSMSSDFFSTGSCSDCCLISVHIGVQTYI